MAPAARSVEWISIALQRGTRAAATARSGDSRTALRSPSPPLLASKAFDREVLDEARAQVPVGNRGDDTELPIDLVV
jgi:hypothetical protein